MSTDKELLELAAKAVGFGYADSHDKWVVFVPAIWNPLDNNGQAFELVVRLNLLIMPYPIDGAVRVTRLDQPDTIEHFGDDPYAATRRAIVRAAAAIGKEMKP